MLDNELLLAMGTLNEEKALSLVKKAIEEDRSPYEIVEICKQGVEIVGKRYSHGQYFLSDLIMSAEIFKGVMKIIEPHIQLNDPNGRSIVLGTIEGDIHDLGKNIMGYMLRSSGFRVYDLGVDVPPERFVQALNDTGSRILGISVLLSFCVGSIKKVVDLLDEVGLRERVKVIVGGYPASQSVKDYTGVDFYAKDVSQALKLCLTFPVD